MIYLDHNATTPPDDRVREAMGPFLGGFFGNPSSLHRLGRLSRNAIDRAREQVAALVGARPSQVIFTSGGTEANNLAISGWAAAHPGGLIAVGATEHPSVTGPAAVWQRRGHPVAQIRVDGLGVLCPLHLRQVLDRRPALVSVMLANNETGVIQDLAPVAEVARACGATLHSDAVQAAGKMAVDFASLGLQLMSLSGHKIGAPKGIGALVLDSSVKLEPILCGGGQEAGMRAGTENVAAIVGFGTAAELAARDLGTRQDHLTQLRHRLESGLAGMVGVTLFAAAADRLCNTVQFGCAGIEGETLVMLLDRAGIALSSGSACASGGGEPSPVLSAMGYPADVAKTAVRASLGATTSAADVDGLLHALAGLQPTQARVA